MKIIDLLNKIANGEEIPKIIKVMGGTYYLCEGDQSGCCYFSEKQGFGGVKLGFDTSVMNEEVEIIEEDKKIEKIDVIDWNDCIHEVTHTEKKIFIEIHKTQTKLNEIIDYLMENKE